MCLTYKNKKSCVYKAFLLQIELFYISDLTFRFVYDILLLQKSKNRLVRFGLELIQLPCDLHNEGISDVTRDENRTCSN